MIAPEIESHASGVPNASKISTAACRIANAYEIDSNPWVVAYSGGKDSTAVLKLLFLALSDAPRLHKPVTVIYCQTGVEIPVLSKLALDTLNAFRNECSKNSLPVETVILRPPLTERFFVKVLGRGYPPPTDKFRWCTNRLAINPVSAFLKQKGHQRSTILLGVRESESSTRSLTLKENNDGQRFWSKQRGGVKRSLFMPILDFSTSDVWAANLTLTPPASLKTQQLADLYANASQCPSDRSENGAPSGSARFGCWTCTVARHGTTLRNLIASGSDELVPLLEFRLWIEAERKKPRNRWRRRRNGDPGPGPMTKQWRRRALDRLLLAQQESGCYLIEPEEISEIERIWRTE
jgi:DNA sulfur modification protein DndC